MTPHDRGSVVDGARSSLLTGAPVEAPEQCRSTRPGAGQIDGSGWEHKNGDPRMPDPHHTGRANPEWECYGCGDPIRRVTTAAPPILTPRQVETVRAVVTESGHKGAATALRLSERTVTFHVHRSLERARSQGYRADCLTDLLLALGWLRVPGAWA